MGGCEEYPCSSSNQLLIKGLLAVYPTVDELLEELIRRQKQTVALLLELPAEFVSRKGSFSRMADSMNLTFTRHYKDHIDQIVETLEQTENVRET